MQVSRYWKSFLDTGKVEDYLAYKEKQSSQARDKGASQVEVSDSWQDEKGKDTCRNTLQ